MIMIEDIVFHRSIALIASLLMLLNAGLFRYLTGAWTTPPVIASLAWFLFTILPSIFLWDVPMNGLASLYIFACIFLFSLGSLVFPWNRLPPQSFSKKAIQENEYWDWPTIGIFGCLVAVAVFSIGPHLAKQGISLFDFVRDLHGTSGKYMSMKYLGQLNKSFIFSVGILSNYLAILIAGLLFASAPRVGFKFIILIFAFVPSLLFMLLYGDKGTLFLCIALFYGSMVSVSVARGQPKLLTKRMAKTLVVILPILIVAVISALYARGMRTDDPALLQFRLSFSVRSYSLGHLYTYSDWFSSYLGHWSAQRYVEMPTPTGYLSLLSFMNGFGISSYMPEGFFDEYLIYPELFQSNIYTMFRGVIQDFGLYGGLIFSLLTGLVNGSIYFLMLQFPRSGFLIAAYAAFFGAVYTSFIISIFVWLSPVVAALIFALGLEMRRWLRDAGWISPIGQSN